PSKPAIFSSQQTVTGTIPELPQDTDSFSEIDLTASSESQAPSRPPTIDYNPLQDLEDSDGRAGPVQYGDTGEQSGGSYLQQTSALTAQFAAQLPNVASTVFSTFSRVIKGTSPAPPAAAPPSYESDPSAAHVVGTYGSPAEFQTTTPSNSNNNSNPSTLGPLINSSAYDPSSAFGAPPQTAPDDRQHSEGQLAAGPPPPAPTFYNPEQVPSAAGLPPPTAHGGISNTYRLGGSKKKTYAHIPGLNTTTAQPVLGSAASSAPNAAVPTPPVTHPFVTPSGYYPPEPVNLGEVKQAAPPENEELPKGKPSLLSYLPSNILEKLPKPSFGGEKKEEPAAPFTGGILSGSIADQFVDVNAAPTGAPVTAVPPPPPLASATPLAATVPSFFAAPPVVEFAPPPVVAPAEASSSTFFTAAAPETANSAGPSVPPVSEPVAAAPPPVFFSPAQIPTVRTAPSVSSKSNPYSSTRASGIGRYKNPLAPIVPPVAGAVFLPNQPPPLASAHQPGAQPLPPPSQTGPTAGVLPSIFTPPATAAAQPVALSSAAEANQPQPPPLASAPPSIFKPSFAPSANPAPVSIFNPTAPIPVVSDKSEYPQQSPLPPPAEGSVQPALIPVPTYQGTASTQPESASVKAEAVPQSSLGSIFNPYATQQQPLEAQQVDTNLNFQQTVTATKPSLYKSENLSIPAPVTSSFPLAAESVQNQFASFSIGTATAIASVASQGVNDFPSSFLGTEPAQSPGSGTAKPIVDSRSKSSENVERRTSQRQAVASFSIGTATAIASVASQGVNDFPSSFLGTEPAQSPGSGAAKPIVDSRSKSSENVLSPPPRPNSNLSEPAAIFPGSVPPADIFLPNPQEEQLTQLPAQDLNGNNGLCNFFGTNLSQPAIPVVESQTNANFVFPAQQPIEQQAKKTVLASPEPTPAINPVDFFNSNTIVPQADATEANSPKTGQTVSSVPLFNFFGRAADPAPPAVVHAPAESVPLVASTPKGPVKEATPTANTTATEQAVSSSVSHVSSFSNLANERYDEEGEQEPGRIEPASNEPIFSSDNLFDFKASAYQDGGFYSRDTGRTYDTYDGNSSMAAMATTSVGAQDTTTGTTNTGGTSVAESSTTNIAYRPTYNHWFYRREIEGKSVWSPFTMADSMALEDGLTTLQARGESADAENDGNPPVIVHTDGGRYDVSIRERTRTPVYWKGPANEVRRCSWFYKTVDSRFVPYEEEVADLLEREYKEAATSGEWHRRVTIPNGETVVFHGPSVIVHFLQTQNPDTWGGGSSPVPTTTNRPRVVKRGIDEFSIDDDEPEKIDHLLFMVHGIGEACDLRFRRVEEVVDEFRSISAQLVQSHYRSSFDRGDVGRVEILPISWHDDLHSEESGVDEKLKSITLPSIPKLRHFTNDTLLDVLFYTSPMFCQSIIDAVGKSLNRLYALFCQRNPSFHGRVSLAGHSLGSLILFDLLCHQKRAEQKQSCEPENSENPDDDTVSPLTPHHAFVNHRPLVRKCSQQINYEVGPAGTGQPYITYPQLMFQPKMFFALGSPIGMFVTIRGIDALGLDFKLPTCDGFFNIFHPYDPVAYRIEALINPDLSTLAPVLIPHHKGRKRMHLELKETVLRVGNDLRQRVTDVFRNTLDTVYSLTAMGSKPDPKAIQKEVDKVLQDQLKFDAAGSTSNLSSGTSDVDSGETNLPLGKLNQSRRVDYVLQEAPFEFINEYLFALTSHVCYWDSEDTMLFLMKEIYSSLGVQTDHQVPQQTMTIERPLAGTSPTVAASSCSLNSNYNLFPQEVPPARDAPDNRL
uniref:DDHD domain-containing protein n=1 Tax=Anopheles quadriannulatus TaxID=34691 RepID=A0A182XIA6_ANOQN